MFRQLIYISASKCGDLREEAQSILASARRHNAMNDVTGLLAYSNRAFLQVLEGPEAAVEATLARIKDDPRHSLTAVISDEMVETRRFADWSMAWRDLPADDPVGKHIQSVTNGADIEHVRDAMLESILDGFFEEDAA